MQYRVISGKPVPAKLYDELVAMGCGRDITITSCLRTQDAVNWARSQGLQLSSQLELWNLAQSGRGNPANPPGYSTHECRSDGIAYSWIPRGMPLFYWMVGVDNTNVALLRQRAAARGWIFTLTYPGSPREGHHGNFRREPVLITFKPLARGSRGRRVGEMTRGLAYLGFLRGEGPDGTGHFGAKVQEALEDFQRRYHLPADGVYGVHTDRQLKTANRGRKRERKAAMKIKDRATREFELARISRRYGPARR